MPWKEMSKMDQKEEFILLWESNRYTVTVLAEMFGISRKTAYKYIKKYQEKGIQGLLEDSRKPRVVANKTADWIEEEIKQLREQFPRWGCSKLLVLLQAKYPSERLPGEATINEVLKRNHLIPERKRRKRIEPIHPIFDPHRANEVWSADFKGKFKLGNGRYCYTLTVADSYSRYLFAAKGMYVGRTGEVKKVFIDLFRRYGLPEQIHTDNGAPFATINALGRLSKLAVWWMEYGVKPVYSDPGHPEQNGRHERMHRELKAEVTRPASYSLQKQQIRMNRFVEEYNEIRPHDAIGKRPPARVHKVSERKYTEKVVEYVYPKECITRYVTKNGAIRAGRDRWIFVSTALMGKTIGLEELGNHIYRLYFREFFLGYLDARKMKVYDIMEYEKGYHV